MADPSQIGVAVVEHGGSYLVGIRGHDVPLAGLAEFPGGKCRPGETPAECAVRECGEETGLQVTPVELLLNCRHTYEHATVDLHFWLCRSLNPMHVKPIHRGFRWVPREELTALNFPAANAPLTVRLQAKKSI